jgi:hypothetical protein
MDCFAARLHGGGCVKEQNILWPDLTQFGSKLEFVRNNPLRGIPMLRLTVYDQQKMEEAYWSFHGVDPNAVNVDWEEVNRHRAAMERSFESLGFAPVPFRSGSVDGTVYHWMTTKLEFSLEELNQLFPKLDVASFCEVPVRSIIAGDELDQERLQEWERVIGVVGHNNHRVLVPLVNPFESPYKDAKNIEPPDHDGMHEVFNRATRVSRSNMHALHRAGYRDNSLMTFYADARDALRDGLSVADLKEVNLPYALPLWVESSGRIVALKDVRFVPEIHHEFSPEKFLCFRRDASGNINTTDFVGDLRRYHAYIDASRDAFDQMMALPKTMDVDGFKSAVLSMAGHKRTIYGHAEDVSFDTHDDVRQAIRVVAGLHRIGFKDEMRLVEAWPKALAENTRSASRDALSRLTGSGVREIGVSSPVGNVVHHEDVGEKIGGARKDFHRRGLDLDDLLCMNALEQEVMVIKQNIWPPLDYRLLRERGWNADAIMLVKMVKDSIGASPDYKRLSRWHPYVSATDDDTYAKIRKTYIEWVVCLRNQFDATKPIDYMEQLEKFRSASLAMNHKMASDSDGYAMKSDMVMGAKVDITLTHADRYYDPKNYAWLTSHRFMTKALNNVRKDGWGALIKSSVDKIEMDDAEKSFKEAIKAIQYPHLEKFERSGLPDWRHGRDVTGEDILEYFGFRAVEFGNWVSNNERQIFLNHSFDAMADMAYVLEIPPRAVSLNGALAVAFGSRGTGGPRSAAAHFEPLRMVYNLTRFKGAGSMAHEWFHALDFYMGQKSGDYFIENSPSAVKAMTSRLKTRDEFMLDAEKRFNGNCHIGGWLGAGPAVDARIDELWLMAKDAGVGSLRSAGGSVLVAKSIMKEFMMKSFIHEFSEAFSKKQGREQIDLWLDGAVAGAVASLILDGRHGLCEEMSWPELVRHISDRGLAGTTESDYQLSAEALDGGGRGKKGSYWATPREMFARAAEQWLFYELAAKGGSSPFLVHGVEEARYADHPVGNPYPAEEDRLRLAPMIAGFVDDYRVRCAKENDAGQEFSL